MTKTDISQPLYIEKLAPRLRLLPPASREKFERLAAARTEGFVLLRSISENLRTLQDKRRALESQLDEYQGKTGRWKPFSPDHPELKKTQMELEETKAAITRTQANLNEKHRLGDPLAGLADGLRHWLTRLPSDRPFEAYNGQPLKLARGASAEAMLEKIRLEIAENAAERHRIQSAPVPSSIAKQLAAEIVDGLAADGAPNATSLLDGVSRIMWPIARREPVPYPVVGNQVVMSQGDDRLINFIAWLCRDQLVKRLQDEVELIADDSEALTPQERRSKEAALALELLQKERVEEALVELIGPTCARRPNADPRAVLGLSSDLPGNQE